MKLSLENRKSIVTGNYLNIVTKTTLDEPSKIIWGGVKLITKNPCKKELLISTAGIFSQGPFEEGEYIRKRSLLIKPNIIPTIYTRNVNYSLKMSLRLKSPINEQEEMDFHKENEVVIVPKELMYQNRSPRPVKLSMSGLNIDVTKDIFKPGETIKINYKIEELAQFQVRLKQKANLICYCESFGSQCGQLEELPPSIAGAAKASKLDEGFFLIKIPEHAELSHDYLYEPPEKELWGVKFGDYSKWFLEFLGDKKREFGGERVSFEIPIIIRTEKAKQKSVVELFAEREEQMELFEPPTIKKGGLNIISIETDKNAAPQAFTYKIKIKSNLSETLTGVTVENTGIQQGLFETAKQTTGFNSWGPGEEKIIEYKLRQEIDSLVSFIEDNSQKQLRIQTKI